MIITCLSPVLKSAFFIGKKDYPEPENIRQASITILDRAVRFRLAQLAPVESQDSIGLEAFTEGVMPRLRAVLECIYDWGYLTWHEYAGRNPSAVDRVRCSVLDCEANRLIDRMLVVGRVIMPHDRPDPAVASEYLMKTAATFAALEVLPRAWQAGFTDAYDDDHWRRCWPDHPQLLKEA